MIQNFFRFGNYQPVWNRQSMIVIHDEEADDDDEKNGGTLMKLNE